jgi:hypothetical protein
MRQSPKHNQLRLVSRPHERTAQRTRRTQQQVALTRDEQRRRHIVQVSVDRRQNRITRICLPYIFRIKNPIGDRHIPTQPIRVAQRVATDRLTTEIRLILEYRNAMIAAVVTGQLDVRQAEITMIEEPDLALSMPYKYVEGDREAFDRTYELTRLNWFNLPPFSKAPSQSS